MSLCRMCFEHISLSDHFNLTFKFFPPCDKHDILNILNRCLNQLMKKKLTSVFLLFNHLHHYSTFESCVTHESQFFFSSNGNERRVDALKVITHNYLEESWSHDSGELDPDPFFETKNMVYVLNIYNTVLTVVFIFHIHC